MTASIQTIYSVAHDVRQLTQFYEKALRLQYQFLDKDAWAQLSDGRLKLAIASPAKPGCAQEHPTRDGWGPRIVFSCENVRQLKERILDAGGSHGAAKYMGDHGHVTTFRDPEGNLFDVLEK